MIFAIHWHESAIDLHMFPIPIPLPASLSIPSLWVFPVHQQLGDFYYWFNFIIGNWSVHIFCSFLIQFWEIVPLRICLLLLGFPFYWHIAFHSSILWLCIYGISCNFSFLISDFIDLVPSYFWWSWLKSYQFCLPFHVTSF